MAGRAALKVESRECFEILCWRLRWRLYGEDLSEEIDRKSDVDGAIEVMW